MNLNEIIAIGVDKVNLVSSLAAPLLKIKIKNTTNTIVPLTNELIITVDKTELVTDERKQIRYQLLTPLLNEDEFVIAPDIVNNKIVMSAFVKRSGVTELEILPYQSISLSKGDNFLTTNYQNATLEVVYPKKNDLTELFLNNALYVENQNTKNATESFFEKAFSEVDENISLEIDQLKANCIVSENNKFSLDQFGNLSVNKIITTEPIETKINLLDVYPIGSLYITVNNTNPTNFFGGTWISFGSGKTLVGVDTTQSEFNTVKKTGGAKTHTLLINELAIHEHWDLKWANNNVTIDGGGTSLKLPHGDWNGWNTGQNGKLKTGGAGGNLPHNNMPPFITVYMWLRTK